MVGSERRDTGVKFPRNQSDAQTGPHSPPLPPKDGSRPAERDQSTLILALGGVQCRGTKSKFAPTHVVGYSARKVDAVSDIPTGKKTT